MEFCASEEWREMVEQIVLPAAMRDVRLDGHVVEIGPGPGFTTDVVHVGVDHLTAVELDPGLAAALARRLEGTNVDVVRGDATRLGLGTDSCDCAVSFNMLHHVPGDDAHDLVFGELARVLRPGGLFVAADSAPRDDLDAFHEGDVYNPVDPDSLRDRLACLGFTDADVRMYDLGWTCSARAGSAVG
jgi:SAM-dependent methyltransferase